MGIKIKNVDRESVLRTHDIPFGPTTSASCSSGVGNYYVVCPVRSKLKRVSYFVGSSGVTADVTASAMVRIIVFNQGRNSETVEVQLSGSTGVTTTLLQYDVNVFSASTNVIVTAGTPFYINVSASEVAGHVQGVLHFEIEPDQA